MNAESPALVGVNIVSTSSVPPAADGRTVVHHEHAGRRLFVVRIDLVRLAQLRIRLRVSNCLGR